MKTRREKEDMLQAEGRKQTSWNWPQIKSSYGAQNERMKQGKMKYYVYRWEEDT